MNAELQRLYEATDNLVNQQFYPGSDTIIGRTPEISLKIRKSGQIIQKFKDLFLKNIEFFQQNDYFKFLLIFKKIKGLNEENIKTIYHELKEKLDFLKEDVDEFDTIITYTIVLNALISYIRDIHFNDAIGEINKRIREKSELISNGKIQEEMDKLFMRNNNYVSILYNISYLDALAESFNFKRVAHICKIQKGKFINRIVNLIISSNA